MRDRRCERLAEPALYRSIGGPDRSEGLKRPSYPAIEALGIATAVETRADLLEMGTELGDPLVGGQASCLSFKPIEIVCVIRILDGWSPGTAESQGRQQAGNSSQNSDALRSNENE